VDGCAPRCHSLRQTPTAILGAVEKDAIHAIAIAGRHRNGFGAALADHLLNNGSAGLFECVCVGRRCELAGIAIHDIHVFVVKELEAVDCAGSEQIPRKPLHLAAIGHEAEGDAALRWIGIA
jgi:hypothetical protein